ncbi:hypothetical protein Ptr902_10014 [Pyrenophora tritici-repentis]|nr:hypothetical protein Ptr902_10014 [Pyrenophora tritici-repentis]
MPMDPLRDEYQISAQDSLRRYSAVNTISSKALQTSSRSSNLILPSPKEGNSTIESPITTLSTSIPGKIEFKVPFPICRPANAGKDESNKDSEDNTLNATSRYQGDNLVILNHSYPKSEYHDETEIFGKGQTVMTEHSKSEAPGTSRISGLNEEQSDAWCLSAMYEKELSLARQEYVSHRDELSTMNPETITATQRAKQTFLRDKMRWTNKALMESKSGNNLT